MGEVYRATDSNLKRQVAIKVLPDAFAQDAERFARFEREAKTPASLNHPNIAAIHGLEKADGARALVMELVEGPTLADRIARALLPVDEALAIAKQIAEALEAAHEHLGLRGRPLRDAQREARVSRRGRQRHRRSDLAKRAGLERASRCAATLDNLRLVTT